MLTESFSSLKHCRYCCCCGCCPFSQVLLVLEDADALFKRGRDSRDRLVELLGYLCSRGGHLKLLVTSGQELLRDTHQRFNGDGSEVVVNIEPLRDADAAKFLNEKLPRPFSKTWLGLHPRAPCTPEDITNAIQNHSVLKEVLKEAQGHPGTLVRGAVTAVEREEDSAGLGSGHACSFFIALRVCCNWRMVVERLMTVMFQVPEVVPSLRFYA